MVDDTGHERRLDARPSDAFDPGRLQADRITIAAYIAFVESRMLDVDDA